MKIDKFIFFGVGLVAGILLAPKKGSETIDDIKEGVLERAEYVRFKFEDAREDLEDQIDELEESFYSKTRQVKDEFIELKNEIESNVEEAIEEVDEEIKN